MPQQIILAEDYGNTELVSSHPSSYTTAFAGTYSVLSYNHPYDGTLATSGPYRTPGGAYEVYEAFEAFDVASINLNSRVLSATITFNYQTISTSPLTELLCCETAYPGTRVPIPADYEDPRTATQYGGTITDGYPSAASSISVALNAAGLAALQQAIIAQGRFNVMVYCARYFPSYGDFSFSAAGVGVPLTYYTDAGATDPSLTVIYEDAGGGVFQCNF